MSTGNFAKFVVTHVRDPVSALLLYADACGWMPLSAQPRIVRLRKPFHCDVFLRPGSTDVGVLREIFAERTYETSMPKDSRVILDVGANIGLASLWFAKRYPSCRILSFEPVEDNFRILNAMMNRNGCRNVQTFPYGWSLRTETVKLGTSVQGRYGDFSVNCGTAACQTREVKLRCASEVLTEMGIDRVSLLKLDVEGCEYGILDSLGGMLPRIDRLVGELHASNADSGVMIDFLSRLRQTHDIDIQKDFGWRVILFRATLRA